jgi:hypothetical protein
VSKQRRPSLWRGEIEWLRGHPLLTLVPGAHYQRLLLVSLRELYALGERPPVDDVRRLLDNGWPSRQGIDYYNRQIVDAWEKLLRSPQTQVKPLWRHDYPAVYPFWRAAIRLSSQEQVGRRLRIVAGEARDAYAEAATRMPHDQRAFRDADWELRRSERALRVWGFVAAADDPEAFAWHAGVLNPESKAWEPPGRRGRTANPSG